jgi:hypothetical protein
MAVPISVFVKIERLATGMPTIPPALLFSLHVSPIPDFLAIRIPLHPGAISFPMAVLLLQPLGSVGKQPKRGTMPGTIRLLTPVPVRAA